MSHTNVVARVDVCLKPKVGKFGRWKLLSISFLIAWHIEEKILALAFTVGIMFIPWSWALLYQIYLKTL